jgi:hypothetical protein
VNENETDGADDADDAYGGEDKAGADGKEAGTDDAAAAAEMMRHTVR